MRWCVLVAICMFATALPAVEPDEILADAKLEERAREISKNLRCLVCQNESIDESSAPLARDLRLLVREMVVAGRPDEEIYGFIEGRYGEFALFNPRPSGSNLILYLAGPTIFAIAAATGLLYVSGRRRRMTDLPRSLNDQEAARLKALLEERRD